MCALKLDEKIFEFCNLMLENRTKIHILIIDDANANKYIYTYMFEGHKNKKILLTIV